MSANIPSTMPLDDLLKLTGYNCPSELQGKTFDEATSGGGSDVEVETNKAVTITTNGATVITPSSGKDAMAKVTATVNVSTSTGMYCFVSDSTYIYVAGNPCSEGTGTYVYTMYTSGSAGAALNKYSKTITRVSDTECSVDASGEGAMQFTRYSDGDLLP